MGGSHRFAQETLCRMHKQKCLGTVWGQRYHICKKSIHNIQTANSGQNLTSHSWVQASPSPPKIQCCVSKKPEPQNKIQIQELIVNIEFGGEGEGRKKTTAAMRR